VDKLNVEKSSKDLNNVIVDCRPSPQNNLSIHRLNRVTVAVNLNVRGVLRLQ